MSNALGDLLALENLGDLLLEKLVTSLAEVDNVGALRAPSYAMSTIFV